MKPLDFPSALSSPGKRTPAWRSTVRMMSMVSVLSCTSPSSRFGGQWSPKTASQSGAGAVPDSCVVWAKYVCLGHAGTLQGARDTIWPPQSVLLNGRVRVAVV